MENYLKEIEEKLKQNINIEVLEIIDNSHKHIGHKFYSKEKFHLHIKIKSSFLRSQKRLEAEKKIMHILKDDLKTKIQALEISID